MGTDPCGTILSHEAHQHFSVLQNLRDATWNARNVRPRKQRKEGSTNQREAEKCTLTRLLWWRGKSITPFLFRICSLSLLMKTIGTVWWNTGKQRLLNIKNKSHALNWYRFQSGWGGTKAAGFSRLFKFVLVLSYEWNINWLRGQLVPVEAAIRTVLDHVLVQERGEQRGHHMLKQLHHAPLRM